MNTLIVVISMLFSQMCHASVYSEVFRAFMSYETPKKYKRNLLKKKKKLINKIPKSKLILTVLGVYDKITSNNISINQRMWKKNNATIVIGLNYNRSSNDLTTTVGGVITL